MRYVSTRGGTASGIGFAEALMQGLAPDGGLYVPEAFPVLSGADLDALVGRPYVEVATHVIGLYTGGDIGRDALRRLLFDAYKGFEHEEVAPLVRLDEGLCVLELFGGPTLAFKDFALQFLGRMFDHVLAERRARVTIVGATSGDTGSAAIEACRGRENIDIVILHPKGRVSEVQRRQMTTVTDPNVHNIAVEGSFDDCQDLVKAMFNDRPFRQRMALSAVNSINWARIVAQIVYYVFATLRLLPGTGRRPVFCVPTGNFGNVYAGYAAMQMGLPAERLLVASNRNDILDRFFRTGIMRQEPAVPSLSPSMDIQVSSNFERLLFDLYGQDGKSVARTMEHFRQGGAFELDAELMARARGVFSSGSLTDAQTTGVIGRIYRTRGYLCDPHTAVGLGVAERYRELHPESLVVALATAHPAKFPDAVEAATGQRPALPPRLGALMEKPERCAVLPNDLDRIKEYIADVCADPSAALGA